MESFDNFFVGQFDTCERLVAVLQYCSVCSTERHLTLGEGDERVVVRGAEDGLILCSC